jgi:sporulation protein YlmC with PRC-barrel domain
MAISEQVQQRSDFIGTQVITRNTGKKLGVINQLWVDVDQREVAVVGLRSTLVTGDQRYMYLTNIRQIGDVILVDDETAIEALDPLDFSTLINNEVITEAGELLGKVRGFKFDTSTGEVTSLIIASLGIPLIPSQILSTYELPVEEIVSTGPDRLIVFEGAEERLNQLTVGLLERMGLGVPPWELGEEEDYIPRTASTSNQLGPGEPTTAYVPARQATPVQQAWDTEAWEAQPVPVERQDYAQPQKSMYAEEDNWSQSGSTPVPKSVESPYEREGDVWADDYEPQELKIPEPQKITEYERESDF